MLARLKQISEIRTGIYMKDAPDADVLYLQVNDFDTCGQFKNTSFPFLKQENIKERHLLQDGDLLFAAKGTCNFCTLYNKAMGMAVASSSFIVIHIVEPERVLPEYINWFLNRDDVMKRLQQNALGGIMPSISKAQFEDLEIDLPPVSIQKKVLQIATLQKTRDDLYFKIAENKNLLINRLLTEVIKKNN